MIKLVRVDHRLLHGQIAMSWTQSVGTDCILIANDEVSSDEIRKSTLKIAKPHGCKLVFKNIADSIEAINSGKTDSYRLLIVIESVKDAVALIKGCSIITSLNIGGVKPKEGTRTISKSVYLLPEEERLLLDLMAEKDLEIEIRQVPTDKKIMIKDLLKN